MNDYNDKLETILNFHQKIEDWDGNKDNLREILFYIFGLQVLTLVR